MAMFVCELQRASLCISFCGGNFCALSDRIQCLVRYRKLLPSPIYQQAKLCQAGKGEKLLGQFLVGMKDKSQFSWRILSFQGSCRQMTKWPWRRSPGSCSWKMWLGTKFLWVTSLYPQKPFSGTWGWDWMGWECQESTQVPPEFSFPLLIEQHFCILFVFKNPSTCASQEGKRKVSPTSPLRKQTWVFQRNFVQRGGEIWKCWF